MSGGVDSSVAAAMLVDAGLRRRRRDDEAVLPRRRRAGPALLLARHRSTTPAASASDRAFRTTCSISSAHSRATSSTTSSPSTRADGRRFRACGATPSRSSGTSSPRPTRIDAQWIATGHYARVDRRRAAPRRGRRQGPEYFLWGIDRAVAARLLLPVGDYQAGDARAAHALGLDVVADKVESQDICFVPDGDHARVIAPAGRRMRRRSRRASS